MSAMPPVVDEQTWRAALDDLRAREKAATRELDAIAAERRRMPMVEMPRLMSSRWLAGTFQRYQKRQKGIRKKAGRSQREAQRIMAVLNLPSV